MRLPEADFGTSRGQEDSPAVPLSPSCLAYPLAFQLGLRRAASLSSRNQDQNWTTHFAGLVLTSQRVAARAIVSALGLWASSAASATTYSASVPCKSLSPPPLRTPSSVRNAVLRPETRPPQGRPYSSPIRVQKIYPACSDPYKHLVVRWRRRGHLRFAKWTVSRLHNMRFYCVCSSIPGTSTA
jgi:hypothetical protein